MNENWKFSDIPYTSPDVEALQTQYDALTRRAREAQSPEELVEIVRQRDALQQEVGLCQAVAFIRAFHDVTDEFYQTELQETLPRLEGSLDSQSLAAAIAESPCAPALDRAFGPQLRRLLTLDHRIHAGGRDLQARISQLTALYQQLTASAKYPVQGELLSGGQLRAALASRDRARRKAAYDAQQQTVLENAGQLEDILRQLVHARIDLARANGFDSFADYGDLAQQRLGYGRAELDAFCRQVQTHITPLYLRLQEEQRRRLGVDTLMPYDRALVFPEGNAVPVADYAGLSPDLAEVHSKTMELLAQPYARDFFGNHAPQFLTEHRYDFIKELCAFCSIHTFETWLYEHPDASLAQWAEEFDRTEKSFGRAQNNEPWRQQVLAGCDLFTNMALYMSPRYVISYALSIVCAQQLKAAYDADPADGWARYHALCASGGSRTYAETLSDAGLPLPYAPGVVESLAQDLARQFWG